MFDRLVRAAMRRGLRQGFGEGSGTWLAIGVAAVGVRVLRRLVHPRPATVLSEQLRPGETLVITHLRQPS